MGKLNQNWFSTDLHRMNIADKKYNAAKQDLSQFASFSMFLNP